MATNMNRIVAILFFMSLCAATYAADIRFAVTRNGLPADEVMVFVNRSIRAHTNGHGIVLLPVNELSFGDTVRFRNIGYGNYSLVYTPEILRNGGAAVELIRTVNAGDIAPGADAHKLLKESLSENAIPYIRDHRLRFDARIAWGKKNGLWPDSIVSAEVTACFKALRVIKLKKMYTIDQARPTYYSPELRTEELEKIEQSAQQAFAHLLFLSRGHKSFRYFYRGTDDNLRIFEFRYKGKNLTENNETLGGFFKVDVATGLISYMEFNLVSVDKNPFRYNVRCEIEPAEGSDCEMVFSGIEVRRYRLIPGTNLAGEELDIKLKNIKKI